MPVTEAQARRALRHADVPWADGIVDPRDPRGQIHPHRGVLSLAAAAFACGFATFRRAEDLSEDLGPGARRALGLPRKVSDSTVYRVVADQSPVGFRETTAAQVKDLWNRKVVQNDVLALGVASTDGKGAWSSTTTEVKGAKESSCDANGRPLWMVGSLRAVLTSSSAAPCLDMEPLAAKEGESTAFRVLFPRLVETYGSWFKVVTGDAGLTARENAEQVVAAEKWYLFGLKGNQPRLHELARARFFACDGKDALARTEETIDGNTLVRELFAISVENDPAVDLRGARQLWYVRQTTIEPNGSRKTEHRYFVTAIPEGVLTRDQELLLVRLHWGIENCHNWTMDLMLHEDDAKPCQKSVKAIEVVLWLRLIGYNFVSAWRARAPKKDKRPMPWKRAMEKLRDALVGHVPSWPEVAQVVPAT